MAGRRERRRPAEATPLCETRRWTQRFRKFTGGAWERQAPPRGAPSGTPPPAERGRTWAIHPATLSRLLRGVASRDQPQERPRYHSVPRRWTRLEFLGLVTAHSRVPRQRSSPTREASLGLCLPSALSGDRAVGLSVARAPSSGAEGAGLVHVEAVASREPHRAADPLGLICWPASIWESSLRRGTGRGRHPRAALAGGRARAGWRPDPS